MKGILFRPSHDFGAVMESFSRLPAFQVVYTSHSTMFRLPDPHADKILLTDKRLSLPALGLMTRLRKEVRLRFDTLPLCPGRTHYYHFKRFKEENGRCFEYDLEHAYLSALHNLGAISEELFEKLNALPKGERLAVVGSLATNKLITDYEHGEKVSMERRRDADLLKVWQTLTYQVDQQMRHWLEEDQSSLFYWVDALFTTKRRKLPHTKEKECQYGVAQNKILFDDGRFFPLLHGRDGAQEETAQGSKV